ncbi:MAG: 50S ribosomal protein L19 [Oligoflexia bacterium]|nr:50S ribosomal protein L19 [Oligoflexia bacterium]MBF0366809.1 50S ribosomal protein L19 [Oligoflexia bacterium]
MNLVDVVNADYISKNEKSFPEFRPGDTVAVHVKIEEESGNKFRVQIFQGICIAMKEKGHISGHFRVRKIASGGIGVERVFPFYSPNVLKIELKERGKSRRAKHFYLRERTGKKAKIEIDYDR